MLRLGSIAVSGVGQIDAWGSVDVNSIRLPPIRSARPLEAELWIGSTLRSLFGRPRLNVWTQEAVESPLSEQGWIPWSLLFVFLLLLFLRRSQTSGHKDDVFCPSSDRRFIVVFEGSVTPRQRPDGHSGSPSACWHTLLLKFKLCLCVACKVYTRLRVQ